MSEFKSFDKISHIGKLHMNITQKMHGSNAQIYIYKDEEGTLQLKPACRTRWITLDDDNAGFAQFVYENRQTLIDALGQGRHFGEWCGPRINSAEGLTEKTLFLFNWRRWSKVELPNRVSTVPVLYTGKISMDAIEDAMKDLKENGSRAVKDFMKPEGVVIEIDGQFYKKAFELEEVAWNKPKDKNPVIREYLDVSHLLQPKRLEKLLSRDSQYIERYPESLKAICADYVKDLEDEQQLVGDEDEVKGIKKALGKSIFHFVKSIINETGNNQCPSLSPLGNQPESTFAEYS